MRYNKFTYGGGGRRAENKANGVGSQDGTRQWKLQDVIIKVYLPPKYSRGMDRTVL